MFDNTVGAAMQYKNKNLCSTLLYAFGILYKNQSTDYTKRF